jgi:cellulose synthase (UDP-forming)
LLTAGYRIVYLDEILSVGEVPQLFQDYLQQRLRWIQGNLQIYWCGTDLPIWQRLNFWQRSFYINLLFYCFTPLFRAIYLFFPLLSFLLGFTLIAAAPNEYLAYGIPFIVLLHGMTSWLTRNHYFQLWTEVYELLLCFPALGRLIQVVRSPFIMPRSLVTPKDRSQKTIRFNSHLAWPFFIFLSLLGLGLFLRYGLPLLSPAILRTPFEGEGLMIAWNLYNGLLVVICLLALIDLPIHRQKERFPVLLPARLDVDGQSYWGRTLDLSETGARLLVTEAAVPAAAKTGYLYLPSVDLDVLVQIVRQQQRRGTQTLALRLMPISEEQESILLKLLYNNHADWLQPKRISAIDAALALVSSLFRMESLKEH